MWYLVIVLVSLSLINDVEQLLIYLFSLCLSSLKNNACSVIAFELAHSLCILPISSVSFLGGNSMWWEKYHLLERNKPVLKTQLLYLLVIVELVTESEGGID